MVQEYLQPPIVYIWAGPLIVWTLLWKAMALWKAGRNKQLGWFVGLFFIHTLGILDLIYIIFFQRE